VTSGKSKVLVDPGDHARLTALSGAETGTLPKPTPLPAQLEAAGVDRNEVTQVVVTHLHYDHFIGVTHSAGGKIAPTFPNARHLVPARDWDMADIVEARAKGERDFAETLGLVQNAGLMDLVNGEVGIAKDIVVEPAPGESPGHQIVSIGPKEERGYIVGDLFHMKEEVIRPELAALWTDAPQLLKVRKGFLERASKESALILSGHMPPGRVRLSRDEISWMEA
jgi:glyoxylase-like metal-dependent hydrolase (beta-lactamase superfamily II)